jgi:hypothetical protein
MMRVFGKTFVSTREHPAYMAGHGKTTPLRFSSLGWPIELPRRTPFMHIPHADPFPSTLDVTGVLMGKVGDVVFGTANRLQLEHAEEFMIYCGSPEAMAARAFARSGLAQVPHRIWTPGQYTADWRPSWRRQQKPMILGICLYPGLDGQAFTLPYVDGCRARYADLMAAYYSSAISDELVHYRQMWEKLHPGRALSGHALSAVVACELGHDADARSIIAALDFDKLNEKREWYHLRGPNEFAPYSFGRIDPKPFHTRQEIVDSIEVGAAFFASGQPGSGAGLDQLAAFVGTSLPPELSDKILLLAAGPAVHHPFAHLSPR